MTPSSGMAAAGRDWFGMGEFAVPEKACTILYLLESVGSTNDFLRGLGAEATGRLCRIEGGHWQVGPLACHAPVSEPKSGTVVVSRLQTAGHGRQGRQWVDCGGLNLSVAFDSERAAVAQGFSVWLGLIVTLVLRDSFDLAAQVKWPNDVLVKGRKLGGILLQRSVKPARPLLVAGIGLNLSAVSQNFPAGLATTATSMRMEKERDFCPAELASALLLRIEAELDEFQARGWLNYYEQWDEMHALRGMSVNVVAGEDEKSGEVVGLSEAGALILRLSGSGEEMLFHAGEVHLLPRDEGWGK